MGINTDSVQKQVYDQIKRDILERRLQPGERIDTKKIAAENGISVMPVRNALQQLATNGLVLERARVGFFVREFTAVEISLILDMRIMFELFCIRNYIQNIDKNYVKSIISRINSSTSSKDLDKADQEIHTMVIHASNNKFMIEEYERLNALFSLGVFGGSAENIDVAKREHIAILNAILRCDNDTAAELLSAHLERARKEIIEAYNVY